MESAERYRKLPPTLQKCLQIVYNSQGRKGSGSPSELIELLESMSYWGLLTERWFQYLPCYDIQGKRKIHLHSFIKEGESVKVMEGTMDGIPVVVKSLISRKHCIRDEMSVYVRLKKAGCPVPWFSTSFYFWGQPVLVLEKLEPLSPYDDEIQLGVQIIEQLEYVHDFGCHSDIKPQNIMKRVPEHYGRIGRNKKYKSQDIEYFLIDYGGVAEEPLKKGYKRWIWTRKWTSQEPHQPNQVVTMTNDFVELAYVMRAIQNWRSVAPKKKTTNIKHVDGDFKTGYEGRLKRYMEAVADHEIVDHTDLCDILLGNLYLEDA